MRNTAIKSIRKIIESVKLIPYLGTRRLCPVCGKTSKRFRDFGSPPRPDAQCAFCKSVERDRLLWLFLKKNTDFFDGRKKTMLHVAPELCFEPRFRKAVGDGYLNADLHSKRAMVKMDIANIEYPDQSFDVIYCSHVLEHVSDDIKAMSEFHRVLKNDGWAILLVPIGAEITIEDSTIVTPEDRLRVFGQHDHVRIYGRDYIQRLTSVGFCVESFDSSDLISDQQSITMGLTGATGEVFFCTKM